jgi:hypothetical protein
MEAGKKTNELGFVGKRPLGGFVHAESRARFEPNVAQAGNEIRGSGLRCVLSFPRGLVWAVFGSLGWLRLSFFFKNFRFFSETVISLVN